MLLILWLTFSNLLKNNFLQFFLFIFELFIYEFSCLSIVYCKLLNSFSTLDIGMITRWYNILWNVVNLCLGEFLQAALIEINY